MGLLLALLAPFAFSAAAEPERFPPVPLYTPNLIVPIEAAGTDLEPQVEVQIQVDALGRVAEVEILSIRPSSELDDAFRRVVVETLERWRYAPALEDGKPVATQLSWGVQFPKRIEQPEGEFVLERGRSLLSSAMDSGGSNRGQSLRREILSMPIEARLKRLEKLAALANDQLKQEQVQQHATPLVVVYTDSQQEGMAAVVANNIEATFKALHGILDGRIQAQPEPYRVVVFMFETRAQYQGLQLRGQSVEWSAGFYSPLGLLAFHTEMPTRESLLAIMLHESTHAFIDRYLAKPGVVFPRWLDEGFAEYVGNSQVKKGVLIPGRTPKKRLFGGPWGVLIGKSHQSISADTVRKAVSRKENITLEKLLGSSRDEFYGTRHDVYYSTAWLAVHFLRHGQEGWEQKFPDLILYVAEGYPAIDAFRQVYGEPAEFEEAFLRYVKKF
ncbi:hypothetical protein ABI59_08955 [Acidobacteria bacterium Mor1]|nr:hypothetical protein ABI59_08955 [Acidobacteria bacterium Mor1]